MRYESLAQARRALVEMGLSGDIVYEVSDGIRTIFYTIDYGDAYYITTQTDYRVIKQHKAAP